MSFGEGNLHERVEQLERKLAGALDMWSTQAATIKAQFERNRELERLVRFMEPFFMSAVSHECGCPEGYFEPHGCDGGCKALKELDERMAALELTEGESRC